MITKINQPKEINIKLHSEDFKQINKLSRKNIVELILGVEIKKTYSQPKLFINFIEK